MLVLPFRYRYPLEARLMLQFQGPCAYGKYGEFCELLVLFTMMLFICYVAIIHYILSMYTNIICYVLLLPLRSSKIPKNNTLSVWESNIGYTRLAW